MKKRLFQILDEMNLHDAENNTRFVSMSTSMISAEKVKQGTKVSMGAGDHVVTDILEQKVIAILLVIDVEEYRKRNVELPETSIQP